MTLMEASQLLGNFGEFAGAIAVVATLFYLAAQVRHSKDAVNANTESLNENRKLQLAGNYQARTDNICRNSALMAGDESLAGILNKASAAGWPSVESLQALDPIELIRWRAYSSLAYLNIENLHYQYELGMLDEDVFTAAATNVIKVSGESWKELGLTRMGRTSFHEYIERVINEK